MSGNLYKYLFGLSRRRKHFVLVLSDAFLLACGFALAMALRLDSFVFAASLESWGAFMAILPLTLVGLGRLGFYRAVIRYVSGRTLRTLCIVISSSSVLMLLFSQISGLFLPRSVPIIYCMLSIGFLGGGRFALSGLYRYSIFRQKIPVIIYGAGSSGRQLKASLDNGADFAPVAFIDDAKQLHGREIGGCRVYPPSKTAKLVAEFKVRSILLAMPSATRQQRKVILEQIEPLAMHVQTVPGMADIVSGRSRLSEIREVSIEDLLGRDPVAPSQELLDANIRGKTVLVTGAGGSIGSELCRQILKQEPRLLLILEMSEFALYKIEQELIEISRESKIVSVLGSVLDEGRIDDVLKRYEVQTLFHAAAYKHVPLVELNPIEGIRNNVLGTLQLVRSALAAGVGSFVLISTDKAVRPTNIMGASKRLAEMICQALAAESLTTMLSIVRFGNVLGSSGSVVPLFRRQIEAGGPITVTHPLVTRYFMTIAEAAQLVIQAGAMSSGGDLFILEMGESVKIVDLAVRMAHLSGLNPVTVGVGEDDGMPLKDGDIEIRFTEMRPGEKLFEELLIDGSAYPTAHPRIFTAREGMLSWDELAPNLIKLERACRDYDIPAIQALLAQMPLGYSPDAQQIMRIVT